MPLSKDLSADIARLAAGATKLERALPIARGMNLDRFRELLGQPCCFALKRPEPFVHSMVERILAVGSAHGSEKGAS